MPTTNGHETGVAYTSERASGPSVVLNWVLGLSTLLGAAAVEAYAYMQVLGTAACSANTCPRLGPGEIGYTVITYGAPAVAVVAVVATFFTARSKRGILVPIVAWALLVLAAIVLAVTFSH
ncbi:hypothetical protein BH09ACT7_BH09ACT7_40270 [soil metagenome]